jgi:pimeloyl-ACP methyl ester carboxylesterase
MAPPGTTITSAQRFTTPVGYCGVNGSLTSTKPGRNRGEGYAILNDKAKALDQAWRATHLTAVATQAITKAYYGINSMYRYAVGCSGGGRIGLNVATTHPEDFDGTFAGAPGSVVVFPAFARNEQYLQLHPEAWISPAELTQIDKAVTAAFDDADARAQSRRNGAVPGRDRPGDVDHQYRQLAALHRSGSTGSVDGHESRRA